VHEYDRFMRQREEADRDSEFHRYTLSCMYVHVYGDVWACVRGGVYGLVIDHGQGRPPPTCHGSYTSVCLSLSVSLFLSLSLCVLV
jgi:hypothetical protein